MDDIVGFYQLIAGSYKSEKPINLTGIVEVRLKTNCVLGSVVNGARKPFLYSFALDRPPSYGIFEEPRIKLFKKVNKSVLSYRTNYLEDDDLKPVDFHNEIIRFACQLSKI